MDIQVLRQLFSKYLNGFLTPEEYEQLAEAAQEQPINSWEEALVPLIENTKETEAFDGQEWQDIISTILRQPVIKPAKKIPMNQWLKRFAVAASVFLVIGLGSYFIFFNKPAKQTEIAKSQEERYRNDVNPGGYKARLTLADGREIILDSAATGQLTTQGGTAIINKNGQLVYQTNGKTNEVLYNTLSTAKGETYVTVLADGSKVWLNAGSSIKYPVAFVANERQVTITGEAYFEVAHNANKPFSVSVNGMNVKVLGTHFNINAYNDETSIKTTLLEGSVKVLTKEKEIVIKPGQQANMKGNGELSIVNTVDLDEVMAWKNGRFYFDGADIKTIMRQLERWYDVEVDYTISSNEFFVAKISRDVPVSEVLRLLELTNLVHFKIDGKKITVTK